MTRYLSGLCVAGPGRCGGGWQDAAPFALGYQLAGWTGATKTDVILGGLLAAAGFAGHFGVTAGLVMQLYADARSAASLAGTADRENSCS